MKLNIRHIFASMTLIVLFTSCAKELEEYNKPAIYWYSQIIESISNGDVDKADNYYSSLQGEHIGSPLLPEATMILAMAHLENEEYILTDHFLDEYIKRYANPNEKEFVEFLKIKAKYRALPNPRRDQVLINDAIQDALAFKQNYPNSTYYSLVDTMAVNLYMADSALNQSIVDLYDRLDKHKSADYYKQIKQQSWIDWSQIQRADTPWYREWFEGDGTSSWYAFMIPDTRSVVSRNSVSDDNKTK